MVEPLPVFPWLCAEEAAAAVLLAVLPDAAPLSKAVELAVSPDAAPDVLLLGPSDAVDVVPMV